MNKEHIGHTGTFMDSLFANKSFYCENWPNSNFQQICKLIAG